MNFTVAPGEKIAIIGQNGSGKSTILDILLRFYQPDSGEVLLNEVSAEQFLLDEYRSLFSVVSQDPYIFLGSIMENIDLQGNAAQEDIEAALHASRVDNYLKRMPDGVNTKIGVNGAKLSGGEKQKLAVARALLKDAPIIIFDEATSGFDVELRRYLHDVIIHKMKGKTVIMITQHYENLKGIDRIYKLENGLLFPYNTAVEGGKE